MVFLYLLFLIIAILIFLGYRQWAIALTILNLILIVVMFYHHVTTPVNVQL